MGQLIELFAPEWVYGDINLANFKDLEFIQPFLEFVDAESYLMSVFFEALNDYVPCDFIE